MDKNPQAVPPRLEPGDDYFDGPFMVFTAAYHLKRESCCGSGCRHCPYRGAVADVAAASDEERAGEGSKRAG